MLPRRCAAANSIGSRVSSSCAPRCGELGDRVERERLELARQRVGERRPLLAVEHGVVGEVRRRVGLIGRDQVDERRLGHRLHRVVRTPLLADGRNRFTGDRLAAQRAGAVRRVDEGRIGERQQLAVQRVVQQIAELRCRPAEGGPQIGTADVADEQRVAGQHGVRDVGALVQVVARGSTSTPACGLACGRPPAGRGPFQSPRHRRAASRRTRPARWPPDRSSRPRGLSARDGRPGNRHGSGSAAHAGSAADARRRTPGTDRRRAADRRRRPCGSTRRRQDTTRGRDN